jgi:hypothetical protein
MDEFLRILVFILISSVKFAFGPPIVYLNSKYDFTFLETNLYAILGGMLGVVVFMYFSEWIYATWSRAKHYFKNKFNPQPLFSEPVADMDTSLHVNYSYVEKGSAAKKNIFSTRSRRMVRIWKKYGLIGLAALTPVLFSIPIGMFFITRVEKNNKKILLYMFISITCWSLLLTSLFELLQVHNIPEIVQ